ncbi:hypothetical protein Y1Q_0007716 [Alligator mississippiensis]|uniref:Uncharacterized protein n=1 Tax=Alligator mississippiensis TaxID=8496 RepID=A0A151NVK9_ALLMI|nr:hypothetical protein Y1Q_0007716 [Alligator mississippiensis]
MGTAAAGGSKVSPSTRADQQLRPRPPDPSTDCKRQRVPSWPPDQLPAQGGCAGYPECQKALKFDVLPHRCSCLTLRPLSGCRDPPQKWLLEARNRSLAG